MRPPAVRKVSAQPRHSPGPHPGAPDAQAPLTAGRGRPCPRVGAGTMGSLGANRGPSAHIRRPARLRFEMGDVRKLPRVVRSPFKI